MSNDVTFGQLVDFAVALPTEVVAEETVLSNLLKPIYAGIAALKNGPLDVKADALGKNLYDLEVKLNTYAQDVSNAATAISLYKNLFGWITIPGSGIILDMFNALLTDAEKFVAGASSGTNPTIAQAKGYLSQFLVATHQLVALMPAIGEYSVGGVSVNQVLIGLDEIAAAI